MDAASDIPRSELASDAELVRRIHIDLIGMAPTAAMARSFVHDQNPNKYTLLVDQLLNERRHARHLANFLDVSLMERRPKKHIEVADWQEYLFQSCLANKPFDTLMRELLVADGGDPKNRIPARFLLDRDADPDLVTRDVGRLYFGRDLQCAQCHNHPNVSDYSQEDYYGLKSFFTRTTLFTDPKTNVVSLMESAEGNPEYRSVFEPATESTATLRLPDGSKITEPKPAAGQEYKVKPAKDVRHIPTISRRQLLADSLAGNRLFQENAANRLWAFVFGQGLIHPVDLTHSDNPPAHREVLQTVADELVARKFDMRAIIRELVLTKAYRRSINMPTATESDLRRAESEIAQLRVKEKAISEQANASEKTIAEIRTKTRAADRVVAAKKKILEAEIAKAKPASDALAAAEKAVQDAKNDLESRQAALASVVQAVAQSEAALARLPKDPALTTVVTQLKSRAEQLKKDINEAGPRLKSLEPSVIAARKKRAEFDPAINKAQGELQSAIQVVLDLRRQRVEWVGKLARERQEFRRLESAIGRWDAWREWAVAEQKVGQLQSKIAALENESRPVQSMVSAFDSDVAAADATVAMITEMMKNPTITGPEAGQILKSHQQHLEMARQRAQAAKTQRDLAANMLLPSKKNRQLLVTERESAVQSADSARTDFARRLARVHAVAPLKPLTAEQFGWTILQATGIVDAYRRSAPAEITKQRKAEAEKAAAEATKKTGKPVKPAEPIAPTPAEVESWVYKQLSGTVNTFVGLYASGNGQPQAEFFATVDQALFVANNGTIESWVSPGQPTVSQAVAKKSPREIADELFWAILNRPPTTEDVLDIEQLLKRRPNDTAAVARDVAWSLIASTEFRFNH
jgi:hypothetical protein